MKSIIFMPLLVLISITAILATSAATTARSEAPPPTTPPAGYSQLKASAEKLFAEHSYAQARDVYKQIATADLPPDEKRWAEFRIADATWRSQSGTHTSDSSIYDKAREQLEAVINAIKRAEDRDLTWAEGQESLGDFWWTRKESQNWGQGWQNYQQALEWWAGSGDLNIARDRYLDIVWKMAEPSWMDGGHYRYGINIPIDVLDNALKIALTPNDKSHVNYLIAMELRQSGDWRHQRRVPQAFEGAIVAGKTADWYDDALFSYGDWLMTTGPSRMLENGQWTREPEYFSALATFRRLVRDFDKGQSRYWDDAQERIKQITTPVLNVSVSNNFFPGSEIQYHLNWRNVKTIELSLYQIDLTRDLKFSRDEDAENNWIQQIELGAAEKLRSWTKDTKDTSEYKPGQSMERMEEPLPLGAYLVEATAGGVKSREVIFVTDAAIMMKTVNDQVLLYACDAANGAPVPKATLKLWKFVRNDRHWNRAEATKQADDQGLCVFDKSDFPTLSNTSNTRYFAAAMLGDRQAMAMNGTGWYSQGTKTWRIYAFTDRPAYRPLETVQWKIIARAPGTSGFTTPANQSLEYEITDPRGSKAGEGTASLNAFGSAWGSVELKKEMPLGEYRVTFWLDKDHHSFVGQAQLFRLEEYKLPEFQVKVQTPEENGKRKAFILGDYVEANIQADYYFGGPVANASVEVVVYQNPHYRWWAPMHDYPWLYEDSNPYRHYWGGGEGQIIKRETIKTDATGKAVITFETPAESQQDFEYRIDARVTDASRREITGSDTVRVTRQRYYVYPRAKHNLYRPSDKVEVDIKAIDANDQPVQTEGIVKVTREEWIEIWLDPTGQEIAGEKLRRLQETNHGRNFPPPPPPNLVNPQPWRLKFRGYKSDDILTTTVKLDAKGEGTFTFTPEKDGFYRVSWRSDDTVAPKEALPILADTTVWVATNATSEIGYRHGGLEILIDKDTVRVGQSAPVMIHTPTNDRYVLFSVEGNNLYSYQLVHVTGTVKLVQVPIEEKHVPNIYLSGLMAHNGQLFQDTKEVVVPPVEQYLNVDVVADQQQYQPGQEGHYTIKTTNVAGKGVPSEIAMSVADEAVAYIQQDYAGDPRKFFFDQRQAQYVQTGSTFNQRGFIKLIKGEKDELMDARLIAANERSDMEAGYYLGKDEKMNFAMQRGQRSGGGGFAGGGDDRWRMMDAAGAAPAPSSAAEGITLGVSLNHAKSMLGERLESKKPAGGMMQDGGEGGGGPAVQVRNDFRSTLFWQPAIVTDEDGVAKVTLKYADSLTGWKATVRAAGNGNQFGVGGTTTRTKMPLIARLQAPRFFLVGDNVTVSGVINNNTDEMQTVTPSLEAEGLTIFAMLKDGQPTKGLGNIDVAPNSEARVDWQINVDSVGNGSAKLKLTAKSKKYADAMEKNFTVYEHGIERFIAKSGKVRGKDVTVSLDIPSQRKTESTVLAVQVSPSMAVTMLDALPYLIDYPYGCTEQTMSRFLPAAITAKTLSNLGIKPEDAMAKVFGGIEQATVNKTQPKGKKDLAKLDEMTKAGLDRLYDFQHSDGGWGWWKEGESDHFMTAYVLWGMCLARNGGINVKQDVIDRAAGFLDKEIVEEEKNPDMQAWLLHALATYHSTAQQVRLSEAQSNAMNNLWTSRDKLNAYTRALLALSAHEFDDEPKAKTLIANLENGVKRDDRPDASVIVKGVQGPNDAVIGTAHWGEDGVYWRWSDGGVEATAFALRAMLAIDPKNKLIEPVTNWLIKNRRGAQWSNTRDTAIVVLAMNDYLRTSGELTPDLECELSVNGHAIATKKISAADVLAAPTRFEIDRQFIRDGANEIRIVRKNEGNSPIYFAAEAKFFSLEEPVPPTGNEIFVRREYYKLVPHPTLLKGIIYDRVPLVDGGSVASGERVQVVMTIEAKNNYEYLLFEDLKPAGLEAVEIRSGSSLNANEMKSRAVDRTFGDGSKSSKDVMKEQAVGDPDDYTGRSRWVYQELRDRKVAMFIDHLPEGVWEVRYDLRAETPGRFHALPVLGQAMYVPEIRANSQELRIAVTEAASN